MAGWTVLDQLTLGMWSCSYGRFVLSSRQACLWYPSTAGRAGITTTQDMVFPVQLAQRLHQAVPNSQLRIIDSAGHMTQFEQPGAVGERGSRFPGPIDAETAHTRFVKLVRR